MNFHMWRGQIEFASLIQSVVKAGWTFTHEYGEERLSIGDTMVFQKGDKTVRAYDEGDIYRLLEKEDE